MSDIVERLKKVEAVERELAHECDMPPEGTANWEYAEACAEAAAKIERLRTLLKAIRNFPNLSTHYGTLIVAEIDAALKEDGDD